MPMSAAYTTPANETHIVHEDESSAGMIAVLIVAALLIIGLLLFAMNMLPFDAPVPNTGADTDVNVPNATTPTAPGADLNAY